MSIISDVGNSVIAAVTGTNLSELQAEATAAEGQIVLAVSAIIGLEVLIALELFLLVVMSFKERR